MKTSIHAKLRSAPRRCLRVAAIAMLLTATSIQLSAQSSVPSTASANTQALSLPARLTPQTRTAIEKLADSLRAAGVPADPLYDKAAEGVLKNGDDVRILAAIRTLARDLRTASSLLGTTAPASDVVNAASALSAGVPVSAVQRLVKRRANSGELDGRLALSFIILADFASRDVPVDAAVKAVDGLLARGAGVAELTAFRTGVERDLSAGRDVGTTLTTRAEGVLRRR
ncbi:MAG: hypothetical protein ABJB74_04330 [Gemmatimonas sp.]